MSSYLVIYLKTKINEIHVSLFIALLLFFGCKTNSLIGTYKWQGKGKILLSLKADSTFEYSSEGEMMVLQTKGRWRVNKSQIFLRSFDSFHNYQVIEKDSFGLNKTIIVLKEENGIGTQGSYIILDSDTNRKYFVNQDEMILIPKDSSNFQSFEIYSANNFDKHYRKNSKANFFDITFSQMDDRFYIDGVLPYERKKIYDPYYSESFFKKGE